MLWSDVLRRILGQEDMGWEVGVRQRKKPHITQKLDEQS